MPVRGIKALSHSYISQNNSGILSETNRLSNTNIDLSVHTNLKLKSSLSTLELRFCAEEALLEFAMEEMPMTSQLLIRDSPNRDYALFEPSSEVIDPNTDLLYTNMLDAQIDAIDFALMALNFRTIKQKPGEELDVYIFSLFDENRKPCMESERNRRLFYPDQTNVYNLNFSGKGVNALDWACGSGNVDCSAIQPGQPCFESDTFVSQASFAFNSYYQQNGACDVSCSFGGTGAKVDKDPSIYTSI
ncbi:unnamed protein product [Dovyalis caffra]|uniref:glucan endo-1,3-beta-D-glucosidase n=1 Tax=Dovyalis caffra TaxID=77055 RepID=A0AAV1R7X0_9ROSI|nr:unnamed protein product [Dovyalis caffra]